MSRGGKAAGGSGRAHGPCTGHRAFCGQKPQQCVTHSMAATYMRLFTLHILPWTGEDLDFIPVSSWARLRGHWVPVYMWPKPGVRAHGRGVPESSGP